ncbi:MAG: FecR domain-containing protein [Saprospiraceae bacterium]|nr:FecR domain-containing protein [Saprospiraceae bacterium]
MDRLEDKILQYIISGKAGGDDALEREIREDPSFDSSEYELLKKIWTESDQLKDYARLPHDQAWQQIARQTGLEKAKKIYPVREWLIAASLTGIAVVMLYFLMRNPFVTHEALAQEEYILPDSSTVEMEAGTIIRFLKPEAFSKADTRDIYLEGKGTFDVVTDAARSFRVITNLTNVEVLGTEFIYIARGDTSEAENIEGQVRFAINDGSKSVVLNPGDKVTYDGSDMNVVEYEPPPPPTTEPQNPISDTRVTIADLIDILDYRFPVDLEFTSTVHYSSVVVPVSINTADLNTLVRQLQENPSINIEVANKGQGYRITSLSGVDSGLQANYTFQMYEAGIPPPE